MCHRDHFALDPQCSTTHFGAFQLKVSVDQDLTVVAEALDDDVVKRWLVSIVFHASVTRQRSSGSETRFSRSHVHEKKTHPCKQGFEKMGATQTDAENLVEADDNYKLEQRNWKTLDLLSFDSTGCSKLWRLSTNLRSARQVVWMVLQNSSLELCVTKTTVKIPVTLESVLVRIHKITR